MAEPSTESTGYGEVGASSGGPRTHSILERLETVLRTGVAWLVLAPGLFVCSACMLVLGLAGATPARAHRAYTGFANLCMRVLSTRLRIAGRQHIVPGQAYVVVANHESNWDPPCLLAGFPELVLRFVVKHEFMLTPILGSALRHTGNVEVMRRRDESDVGRIQDVMGARHPDVSILFFAEGTRSHDGGLHPFKSGAFATAIGYGLPVLPIGIAGTRPIWKRHRFWLHRGTVAIEVGAPIPVEGLRHDDRGTLRDQGFAAVTALRTRARQRLRAESVEPGGID